MAIIITTSDPRRMLEAIKKAIREKHVETWAYNDGYFTHSPAQWRGQAFFKPSIIGEGLILNIIRPRDRNVSSEAYAVYHGRFIEMLLAHFDTIFESARATALTVS
jgi:hypothetical protein